MHPKLKALLDRVMLETHQEHLRASTAERILRAVRKFHGLAYSFQQDLHEQSFDLGCGVYDAGISLAFAPTLRSVHLVLLHLETGETVEAKLHGSLSDYFKGEKGDHHAARIGTKLKVKSTSKLLAATVVYIAPPANIDKESFATWLTLEQLDFAVYDGIAYTMAAIGDDAAGIHLQEARRLLTQLADSLDTV